MASMINLRLVGKRLFDGLYDYPPYLTSLVILVFNNRLWKSIFNPVRDRGSFYDPPVFIATVLF